MKPTGETIQMGRLPFLSYCYTGMVAYFTLITPADFEIYAKIFMYLSAGLLSLVSAFFVYRNKGRGRK